MADWCSKQACEDLDISESCLRALVRNNRIPHYRVGKLIRFQPDVLHAWRAAGGTGAEHRAPTIAQAPTPVAARPKGRRTALRRTDVPGSVAGPSAAWRSQADRSGAAGR
jgi:excisionase family DNA binding protein